MGAVDGSSEERRWVPRAADWVGSLAALCLLLPGRFDLSGAPHSVPARSAQPAPPSVEAKPAPEVTGRMAVASGGSGGSSGRGGLTVVVWSPRRGPVSGARVVLRNLWEAETWQRESDARGEVRFESPPEGECLLRAWGPRGCSRVVGPVSCQGGGPPVQLWLGPCEHVVLELRHAVTGKAPSGGRARLLLDATGRWALSGTAGSNGRVALGPLPAGRYAAQVGAEGMLSREVRFVVPASGPVRVELVPGGRVEGEVLDAEGRPLKGAWVRWDLGRPDGSSEDAPSSGWGRGSGSGRLIPLGQLGVVPGPLRPMPASLAPVSMPTPDALQTRADADGHFVLRGVPPGRGRVVASAEGHAPRASRWWQLPPGGELDRLSLRLDPGGVLHGRVLAAMGERGVPRVPVLAEVDLEPAPRFTSTDGEGRFQLEGVAGDVRLTLGPPGPGRVRAVVHVAAGRIREASWRLPGLVGALQVRVLDAAERPVEGAWVALRSARRSIQGRWEARTGQDGFARFEAVVEPPWLLEAWHETKGEASGRLDASPPGGEAVLRLRAMRVLRARVLEPDGRGVEGVRVTWTSRVREEARTDRTDDEGAFALQVGAQEAGVLRIEAAGFVPWSLHVTPEVEIPRRIVLQPAGSVEGRVRDRYGTEVHGARVCVAEGQQQECGGASAVSDASGRFVLAGVAAGDRWLWVEHPAAGTARVGPVRVLPGERREGVEVRLPERADRVVPR